MQNTIDRTELIKSYREAGIDVNMFSDEALNEFYFFNKSWLQSIRNSGWLTPNPWHEVEEWEEIKLSQLAFEIGLDPETNEAELIAEARKIYPLVFKLTYSILVK